MDLRQIFGQPPPEDCNNTNCLEHTPEGNALLTVLKCVNRDMADFANIQNVWTQERLEDSLRKALDLVIQWNPEPKGEKVSIKE